MSAYQKLKAGLAAFAKEAKTKADQLERKKIELAELTKLPLPRSDLAAGIEKMLDAQAQHYPEKLAQTLAGIIANPAFNFENSQLDLISSFGGSCQPGALPKANALWFFGDQIKKRVTDAVMKMPYPEKIGKPLAERKPLIEKLEAEIEHLETEVADSQKQATDLSIHVGTPKTEREQKVALTENVSRLAKATPYPAHTIRAMLTDGLNPEAEAMKIPAKSHG